MRIALPPAPQVRALCLAAFAAVLVQLFFLDEPRYLVEIKNVVWDKACHAMAFGGFATLLWFAVGFESPWLNWGLMVAVGAVDEFHQIFVPTRSADVLDVVADAVGAAIATFVLTRMSRMRSLPCAESLVPSPGAMSSPSSSRA